MNTAKLSQFVLNTLIVTTIAFGLVGIVTPPDPYLLTIGLAVVLPFIPLFSYVLTYRSDYELISIEDFTVSKFDQFILMTLGSMSFILYLSLFAIPPDPLTLVISTAVLFPIVIFFFRMFLRIDLNIN